jgi:hypothetical protein
LRVDDVLAVLSRAERLEQDAAPNLPGTQAVSSLWMNNET